MKRFFSAGCWFQTIVNYGEDRTPTTFLNFEDNPVSFMIKFLPSVLYWLFPEAVVETLSQASYLFYVNCSRYIPNREGRTHFTISLRAGSRWSRSTRGVAASVKSSAAKQRAKPESGTSSRDSFPLDRFAFLYLRAWFKVELARSLLEFDVLRGSLEVQE